MRVRIHPASVARRLSLGAIGLASLVAFGCGNTQTYPAQVTGKVTYQGKPLAKGSIAFLPADPGSGSPAVGEIDAAGTYRLQTVEPGDGVRVGEYRVSVTARESEPDIMNDPKAFEKVKSLIPAKYEKADSSGLTASVKPGSNEIPFELK